MDFSKPSFLMALLYSVQPWDSHSPSVGLKSPTVLHACWLHSAVCAFAVHCRSWLPSKISTTYEVNYLLLQLSGNHI